MHVLGNCIIVLFLYYKICIALLLYCICIAFCIALLYYKIWSLKSLPNTMRFQIICTILAWCQAHQIKHEYAVRSQLHNMLP